MCYNTEQAFTEKGEPQNNIQYCVFSPLMYDRKNTIFKGELEHVG